jgi:16S rRNA (guanine527-N7)-methyltransferase
VSRALQELDAGAARILNRALTDRELGRFQKYLELLVQWQRVQRLVGSTEPSWIVQNLFLDSLLFLRVLPPGVQSVGDLGSGAGLPGIPIKIVRADLPVTLIEGRDRRISFLSTVVRELELEGAQVVHARGEEFARENSRAFGAVVLRCAGNYESVIPVARSLICPGGVVVASGPPKRMPLKGGEWVEVQGSLPNRLRRFAVFSA